LPINGAASSADNFFRWFECKVASLPEIFVSANENLVAIALKGVPHMVKQQNSVDFDVLRAVASSCESTTFLSASREVKKAMQKRVMSLVGLQQCTPEESDVIFLEWWHTVELLVPKQYGPGFNSLITFVAWCLWKHHNACVFEGTPPSAPRIIQDIKDDTTMWCIADAMGLSNLWR
jgi:hypothetical protein